MLAVTEQRLDQFADHLTDLIARVPRSATVDPAFTLRPLTKLIIAFLVIVALLIILGVVSLKTLNETVEKVFPHLASGK